MLSLFRIPSTLAEFADMADKINQAAHSHKRAQIKPMPTSPPIIATEDIPDMLELKNLGVQSSTYNKNASKNKQTTKDKRASEDKKQPALPDQVGQIQPTTKSNSKPKTQEKKSDKPKPKQKSWPSNPNELLPYSELVSPLKDILQKGYRLFRKDEIKGFEYTGFNIGKQELQTHPSPCVRLSEEGVKFEKTKNYYLIDIVLNVLFLLGVEQGRRAERRDMKPIEEFLGTLETYRKRNKDQRIRIDELELMLELKTQYGNMTDDEFNAALKTGLEERRAIRIEELKEELKLDASRSTFQFKTPPRAKFKELTKLAYTLSKDTCSSQQWEEILSERGWTSNDFKKRCKQKNIKTFYC